VPGLQRYALWLKILGGLGLAQSVFIPAMLSLTPVGELLTQLVKKLIHTRPGIVELAMTATNGVFLLGLVVFSMALACAWSLTHGRERWVAVSAATLMLSPIGTVYLWPASLPLGFMLLSKLTRDDARLAFGMPEAQARQPGRTELEHVAIVLGLGGVLGLMWTVFVGTVAVHQPGEAGGKVIVFGLVALNGLMSVLWVLAGVLCWRGKSRGVVLGVLGASFVPCLCGWIAAAPLAVWAIVALRRPQVVAVFT